MPAKPSSRKKASPRLELTVQFGRGTRIAPLTTARLRAIIKATVVSDLSITVRFATQREARRLNTQFRQRGYVPDVLTFPYPAEQAADIVICTPVVRRHAREQGKTFAQHLSHIVVHGCLHAQGYTHDTAGHAARMEALEKQILASFAIADPYLAR